MLFFLIQKARAKLFRALQSLLHLPILNKTRISAQKDIRNFPAVELGRPCIDRWRHKPVLKAVAQC